MDELDLAVSIAYVKSIKFWLALGGGWHPELPPGQAREGVLGEGFLCHAGPLQNLLASPIPISGC